MTDAPLPREEAERLLALCEKATPGEWARYKTEAAVWSPRAKMYVARADRNYHNWRNDLDFVSAARTALPRALREVLRLQDGYANGNLIASAPELASALQQLLSVVHDETAFLMVDTGERWRVAAHHAYAALDAASIVRDGTCDHEWVSARNKAVKSGLICSKCSAIKAEVDALGIVPEDEE